MKEFNLRYLYKHLGEALKEVPFNITNHNKVVATVYPYTLEVQPFLIDNKLCRRMQNGDIEQYDVESQTWSKI